MALPLRPNESIVYPQPYEETKYNPLVVTNERIFQVNELGGVLFMEARQVTGVGRGINQRIFLVCALLALVGLPLAIVGAVTWRGADKHLAAYDKSGPPKVRTRSVAEKKEIAEYKAAKSNYVKGLVLAAVGALCCVGAFFLFKKRFTIILGGAGRIQTIQVKDRNQQTQIIMTIQAIVSSAKQTAASQAAAAAAARPQPRR